jgi:hypothetical protein
MDDMVLLSVTYLQADTYGTTLAELRQTTGLVR